MQNDPDLRWRFLPIPEGQKGDLVELDLDEQRLTFVVNYDLMPVQQAVERITANSDSRPLLVVPQLSDRILATCKERGIAIIDINGRAYLRAPGLLVERGPLPGRNFRLASGPRNPFAGKSARIVRSLLADLNHTWTQPEIKWRTHASTGLVSRIINYLWEQGFIQKTSPHEYCMRDHLGLVDAWADADRWTKRVHTARYAGFMGTPVELAQQLQEWARRESIAIAFTQWIAAWLRHPYTEPPLTSAYVSHLPDAATLEHLGLRPVSEGGKLWLHVPDDEGIFLETQTCQGLTLTTDAQIFLDLQQTGLRGPEQADALRHGDNFCKP